MRYTPLPTELALLDDMSAQERLHYAATRMLESEEVWSLGQDEGWTIRDNDDAGGLISVWPYRQFADALREAEDEPQSVSLEHFVYGVLPMCDEADIVLEVFPHKQEAGYRLSATALSELLSGLMESGEYQLEG